MCVCYTTQQKKSTTSESAGFRAVAAAMYVVVMSHSPGCSKKVEGSQGSKKKIDATQIASIWRRKSVKKIALQHNKRRRLDEVEVVI